MLPYGITGVNSLAPGRSGYDSKNWIFNLVLLISFFRSSHDNALRWMPQDLTDDKSTLVQVMAWCRQATSHYLSQCWLSSLSPYVARPQWVKQNSHSMNPMIKVSNYIHILKYQGFSRKYSCVICCHVNAQLTVPCAYFRIPSWTLTWSPTLMGGRFRKSLP